MKRRDKPSLSPQNVTPGSGLGPGVHAWYYESRRGIELIVQTRDAHGVLIAVGSPVIKIPARLLARSARRCGWQRRPAAARTPPGARP